MIIHRFVKNTNLRVFLKNISHNSGCQKCLKNIERRDIFKYFLFDYNYSYAENIMDTFISFWIFFLFYIIWDMPTSLMIKEAKILVINFLIHQTKNVDYWTLKNMNIGTVSRLWNLK